MSEVGSTVVSPKSTDDEPPVVLAVEPPAGVAAGLAVAVELEAAVKLDEALAKAGVGDNVDKDRAAKLDREVGADGFLLA